jgi:hypothetical protein
MSHDQASVLQYAIRERLRLAGIFLAVVGGLNVLLGGWVLLAGIQHMQMDEVQRKAELDEAWDKQSDDTKKKLEAAGYDKEWMRKVLDAVGPVGTGIGAVALLAGILTTLGGIRMAKARSYGLAVTGAVLAIIPVVSCLGCVGLGQGIGIWALVVLLNRDAKAAFATPPLPPDEAPFMS